MSIVIPPELETRSRCYLDVRTLWDANAREFRSSRSLGHVDDHAAKSCTWKRNIINLRQAHVGLARF